MMDFDITDQSSFMKMRVMEVLRDVIDPELGINIVDMGLIYSVKINEPKKQICVDMTLSSKYCPMGDSILKAVGNCLEHSFEGYEGVVELVWEPVWSYDSISEEGRKFLGF